MAKGTIIQLSGVSGKIKGDDKKTYKFNKRAMAEGDIKEAQRGQRVSFEADGNRATEVKLQAETVDLTPKKPPVAPTKPKTRQSHSSTTQPTVQGDFLNPYNFVRLIETKRPKDSVLGNCPPPPHDRYVGLTGRITINVAAETPLFISDSHAVEGKDHKTYRFFEYDGDPALPASSLRGMLRSTFETVTNSCLGVFSKFGRLEYRTPTGYARKLKAGIVKSLPTSKKDGEIVLCYHTKVGAYYKGQKSNRNLLNDANWKCGDYAWARITPGIKGRAWQLADAEVGINSTTIKSRTVSGYLKITGENIENKNNEFLFLDPDRHGNLGEVTYKLAVMTDYNVVLKGQIEDDRLEGSLFQNEKLTVGDLVWVETQGNKAINVVRVKIPRVLYEHTVEKLLPSQFHPCTNYNCLCPACRTFGWVHKDAATLNTKEEVAYAGRIRLSHATPVKDTVKQRTEAVTLAILGSPKPTQTNFYLLNKNGKPQAGVDYNQNTAKLRGRKFYRHHGDEPSKHDSGYEYERKTGQKDGEYFDGKVDQNRTVRGMVEPESEFEFTLEFENLAALELGALLWSLELEEGMFHRLGYAKPLGFGSVDLSVSKVEILDWAKRLESLDEGAGWDDVTEQKGACIKDFTDVMKAHYGNEFEQVLAEMKAILSQPDLPVHYPRKEDTPSVDGKNFEWFMENKTQTLDLATEDKGLTQ